MSEETTSNEDSLFPEDFDELLDEAEEDEEGEAEGYKPGLAFDTDFVKDGRYRLLSCSGIEAWKQWCINCLSFDRDSSPLYSSDFGVSMDDVFAAETREEAENILNTEISEALEADPYGRTEYVESVDFTWDTDSVTVDVEVVGIDEATVDVQVTIER